MNEKPAQPVSQMASLARSLALGGLLVIVLGQVYLRVTPVIYRTSIRIALNRWTFTKALKSDGDKIEGEAGLALAECRELSSATNFDLVAKQLNLTEQWKNRPQSQARLTPETVRNLLRQEVAIRPVGETLSFEVAATDADPRLAAAMAGAFVDIYVTTRSNEIAQAVQSLLKSPENGFSEWDAKVKQAKARVDDLYIKLAAERMRDTNQYYDAESYELLSQKRDSLSRELKNRKKELDELKALSMDDLRRTLSATEKDPQLASLLAAVKKAQNDMGGDKTNSAPNVEKYERLRDSLNEKIDAQLKNILEAKQTRIEESASALKRFELKLQNASTNPPPPSPVEVDYNQARSDLEAIQADNSFLTKVDEAKIGRAAPLPILKLNYTPRILDPMEPSALPYSPDPKIGPLSLVIGVVSLCGAGILAILPRKLRQKSARLEQRS